MARKQNSESGFTMIEAVIALAVVAIVLAAIGSLVASNARGVQFVDDHVALMQTARLIASGIPRNGERFPKDTTGEVDGYRWQMRISPFLIGNGAAGAQFSPERIELRVRSPAGTTVLLETVRLQNRSEP
ncbi:type II secretion system protein [Bradyrhizobium sp. INPA01-394B]|uniref:Type II secretion system protein n=1 Tax=Bradyrhizobium campsiandrae TaxID=1729892 RepID=A0ABR7UA63_9BRAD|nr:type II secretion system protein [Bradyrhizobium campsiandrae]MBC9879632.1 type II secretion system protein [Bradyrhizobium campsiandrae]MBC9980763.1 type II secretion system protein [Bradyrhizobium campsiandrae]